MMIVIPIPALGAGLLAALLYHAEAQGWIYGITVPFLPILVFALATMRYSHHGAISAGVMASIALLFLWSPMQALAHCTAQIIPAIIFFRSLMMVAIDPERKLLHWTPLGYALTLACMYTALFYLALGMSEHAFPFMLKQSYLSDIPLLIEQIQKEFPEYKFPKETLQEILISSLWCHYVLMLILAAGLAHQIIQCFSASPRPSVHLTPYVPAHPIFILLLLVWFLGAEMTGSLAHAARIAGIILLIPYTCSGIAALHNAIKRFHLPRTNLIFFAVYASCIIIPVIGSTLLATSTLYGLYSYARIALMRAHPSRR